MKEEFIRFTKTASEGRGPSLELDRKIRARVERDLAPSSIRVLGKLSGLHLVSAALTLSVCPQFGFRLWGDGMGLMKGFMKLGPGACTLACGFFFLGASYLAASLALRNEELRVLREHRFLALFSLISLSMGFFLMVDAEVYLGLTSALWLFGSFMGGWLTLELGWAVRAHKAFG